MTTEVSDDARNNVQSDIDALNLQLKHTSALPSNVRDKVESDLREKLRKYQTIQNGFSMKSSKDSKNPSSYEDAIDNSGLSMDQRKGFKSGIDIFNSTSGVDFGKVGGKMKDTISKYEKLAGEDNFINDRMRQNANDQENSLRGQQANNHIQGSMAMAQRGQLQRQANSDIAKVQRDNYTTAVDRLAELYSGERASAIDLAGKMAGLNTK